MYRISSKYSTPLIIALFLALRNIPYLSDFWRMCDRPNFLGALHLSHLTDQFMSDKVCVRK